MMQGILLAAGFSRRFGADKLMQQLPSGLSVIESAAKNLCSILPQSVAVVRPGNTKLEERLQSCGMSVLVNENARLGMGHSIAAGVQATEGAAAWLIALGDMPYIHPETIATIVSASKSAESIVVPVFENRRGHPVLFGSAWRHVLSNLSGDFGASPLLEAQRARVTRIRVDDPGIVQDVDYQEDLRRAASLSES